MVVLVNDRNGEVSRIAWLRLALGFGLAPLAPALLFVVPAGFDPGDLGENVKRSVWIFELTAVYAYPVVVFLGIPIYILLQYIKRSSFVVYFLFGFLLGNAALIFHLFLFRELSVFSYLNPFVSALFGCMGILATTVFWLICRPGKYNLAFQGRAA